MYKQVDIKNAWVYHQKKCAEGKLVSVEESLKLLSCGWVENPRFFTTKKAIDENLHIDVEGDKIPEITKK